MTSIYYDNVNADILDRMPRGLDLVVEVGVGAGKLGQTYLAESPSTTYCGFEVVEQVAAIARQRLGRVFVGDIEAGALLAEYDEWAAGRGAELLVCGDVLEHLRDPWSFVAAFRRRMRSGGTCIACIPNVSNWSLVLGQLQGHWTYADSGLLDRTHLRFFTLESAADMFKQAGWAVTQATARIVNREETKNALEAFEPLIERLGLSRDNVRRNLGAFQWVIEARNP